MDAGLIQCSVAPLNGSGWRMVESQREAATLSITSSMEHQSILEALLEDQSKPNYLPGSEDLHYLLKTPFRYPPLKWGSRFGRLTDPGMFYGSREIATAVAECAYYRFVYLAGLSQPPPGRITTKHRLFKFDYRTTSGLSLLQRPFTEMPELQSKTHYQQSQQLGDYARSAGVQLIEYASARSFVAGVNYAMIHPAAFISRQPLESVENILCLLSETICSFKVNGSIYTFERNKFDDNAVFPVVN